MPVAEAHDRRERPSHIRAGRYATVLGVTDAAPLVLSGSPHRWGLVSIGCGALALVGAAIGLSGHYVVVGWMIAAAFAWFAIVATKQARRSDHVLLHEQTFQVIHMGSATTRDFAACSEFEVWREGSNCLVVFDSPLDDALPNAEANRAITGRSGSLPHRFGVRAEELAQLMNMARARALSHDPEPDEAP